MFSSTLSVSILRLRGDQADDPDLYPIRLSGVSESVESENMGSQNTGDLQPAESSIPSSANTTSSGSPPSTSTRLTKRRRIPAGDQVSKGFFEAMDIDSTYRTPLESPPKPMVCFYVRFSAAEKTFEDYDRTFYLSERTVRDLT